jgi:hypothetical protein
MEILIVLSLLAICAALLCLAKKIPNKKISSTLPISEQPSNKLKELDTAIENWLLLLELPQFEDQAKRQEAAQKLSNLLIENLMLKQCPSRI